MALEDHQLVMQDVRDSMKIMHEDFRDLCAAVQAERAAVTDLAYEMRMARINRGRSGNGGDGKEKAQN